MQTSPHRRPFRVWNTPGMLWCWLRDMQVRHKLMILLLMALVVQALGILGTFYVIQRVKIGSTLYRTIEDYRNMREVMVLLKGELGEVRALVLSLVTETRRDVMQQAWKDILDIRRIISAEFVRLLGQLTHEDIKMAIADAQYLWHAYLRTEQEDVLPVLLAGDQTTAKFFIHGLQKRRYDRFLDEVDAALHTIQLRVEEVEKHAAQTVVYSTFLLGGASLLLGVVLVLGSLALIASITSPLRDLTMAARQVARGDIDQQVSYQATNEIGILADAIRQLIAYTKQNVVLQQVVEERRVALEQSNHQLQREIDEHKQTERMLTQYTEELKAAHAAAEAANQAKSMFLANMSHELRTPLHAILSFADFGLDKVGTAPTEKLRYYFTHIDQCGKVLLTLVNALLDLAKLEAGKMTFEFEHTDLSILVTAVTDEFISLTAERRLTIRLLSSEGTIEVCLDATKIMQVLRNLLSNAVKFSPDGGTIEISIRREVQSIVVAIRDQGMGVPEGELETIFDKFIQSSRTRTGAGGTGLGLSICREIIAAHQGRIWAENAPAGGAVFSFELPLSAPHGTGTEPALVGARGAARL